MWWEMIVNRTAVVTRITSVTIVITIILKNNNNKIVNRE